MVMLCFVLDLRSLSPPLLEDLKQSLLRLANYFAISTPVAASVHSEAMLLQDLIGLCYVFQNRISLENELKIAHSPQGSFSLRDFHHAVNNLPTNAFLPQFSSSETLCCDGDIKLSAILSEEVLYSWKDREKDIAKKVILISSCVAKSLDCETRKTLMDAADKCVSVEFFFLEHESKHHGEIPERINNFMKQIGDLENCSFQAHVPDARVLNGVVKRWLQELKDSVEQQLQATFVFKDNLAGSLDHLSCNLCKSLAQVIDGFDPCQTCRCHGVPLDYSNKENKKKSYLCPVMGNVIRATDVNENSLMIGGKQSVLFMPSFHCSAKLQQISSSIEFTIIERTNLGSLNEGLILGTSYIVTPSVCYESDDIDKSEMNVQIFHGLCTLLHSLDQGLICSSNYNIETLMETSFRFYYILLPSDKELMLLRLLAGSEEVLPWPDAGQYFDFSVPEDIEKSIRACLLKIEVCDYNPLLHERGLHQELNLLVKESLPFGAAASKQEELTAESKSMQQDSSVLLSAQATDATALTKTTPALNQEVKPNPNGQESLKVAQPLKQQQSDVASTKEGTSKLNEKNEKETTARITEEWEQLIVTEVPKKYFPTCSFKPKLDQPVFNTQSSRLDDKTSRILERLEVPRRSKARMGSPVISDSFTADAMIPAKEPLIPFETSNAVGQGTSASEPMKFSQPLKPNFQRLKRKHR